MTQVCIGIPGVRRVSLLICALSNIPQYDIEENLASQDQSGVLAGPMNTLYRPGGVLMPRQHSAPPLPELTSAFGLPDLGQLQLTTAPEALPRSCHSPLGDGLCAGSPRLPERPHTSRMYGDRAYAGTWSVKSDLHGLGLGENLGGIPSAQNLQGIPPAIPPASINCVKESLSYRIARQSRLNSSSAKQTGSGQQNGCGSMTEARASSLHQQGSPSPVTQEVRMRQTQS